MIRIAIILTGTVKPQVVGGNFTPEQRMDMYTSTLRYYATTIGTKYPVVFVENSEADLSSWSIEFKDLLNLEILQFRPTEAGNGDFDNSRGKGYNEFLMLNKCMTQSRLLKDCDYFLKITGRYAMVNIVTMIKEIENRVKPKIVYMGDIKDTKFYEYLGIKTCSSHWGDTRFFVVQKDFYNEEMCNAYLEMDDYVVGKWAEDYMVRLSRKFRNDNRFIFRFRHQVEFNGVSGTLTSLNGKTYNSKINKIKNHLDHCIRIIFPKWLI